MEGGRERGGEDNKTRQLSSTPLYSADFSAAEGSGQGQSLPSTCKEHCPSVAQS